MLTTFFLQNHQKFYEWSRNTYFKDQEYFPKTLTVRKSQLTLVAKKVWSDDKPVLSLSVVCSTYVSRCSHLLSEGQCCGVSDLASKLPLAYANIGT